MINILRGRRSIRRYEKRPLDDESLAMLKEALLRSPSSRGPIRPIHKTRIERTTVR